MFVVCCVLFVVVRHVLFVVCCYVLFVVRASLCVLVWCWRFAVDHGCLALVAVRCVCCLM